MDKSGDKLLSEKPDLNQVLFSWKSASHPYKKRSRVFYQTIAAFSFLMIVIVFFLHEFLLIGVILSIAFVVYVISSVPPIEIEHKILPIGFDNVGRVFRWEELNSFWFDRRWNQDIMVIQTHYPLQPQLQAVIDSDMRDKLKNLMGKYLLYVEKPPKTAFDKLSEWMMNKLPLESAS
ncbi:MAG: hypothetical protein UV73_C0015G0030 [Candidatus Gottesmanbacteria bacterium GW2011_GWA2_43_14]|uniref:DUF5673 domain-containing protein n=1 Tax=Candidatus Gottesmanbacteria bacterium GW2011_GWA2_43_14 TaxID=1618443 RepID=A0A0G1DCV6_9BACT|nr:MAG: hypothetical protein UV73_C0015G0030 [Candidatus Gottesmanbacteria bacterium GW2011_GWA2_43_14]